MRLTVENGGDIVSSGITSDFGGSFSLINQDGRSIMEHVFAGIPRAMFYGSSKVPLLLNYFMQKRQLLLPTIADEGGDYTMKPTTGTCPFDRSGWFVGRGYS